MTADELARAALKRKADQREKDRRRATYLQSVKTVLESIQRQGVYWPSSAQGTFGRWRETPRDW